MSPQALAGNPFVPVLDLASRDDARLSADLDRAFRTSGFAVVVGHGIRGSLRRSLQRTLLDFFHLPADAKAALAPTHAGGYGWTDRSDVGGTGRPELCEVYAAGPRGEPGAPTPEQNRWPAGVPELRDVWLDYYAAAGRPADTLLRLAALALGEPDDTFARHHREPSSPMIANWYPAQSGRTRTDRVRKGAHSDWGSLTVLWSDGRPGLEIRTPAGGWHPLNLPPGCLVVNVGDLMSRWTNGRWRATVHRVAVPPGGARERLSVAWFGLPSYDSMIAALPSCLPPGGVPAPRPVRCGDWFDEKLRGAYDLAPR
jgi:isopenicillin N synthase-like dioxygenase